MRFVVSDRGLEPFDDAARLFLNHQAEGQTLDVELLYPRDMHEHRKIMGMIGDVAKAIKMPFETLRAKLLISTGNFQLLDFNDLAMPVVSVNSMSRHHMKDHELHEFWHDAREVIRKEYLPRVDDAALRDQLADMLSLETS
jgi:hypothetical protein